MFLHYKPFTQTRDLDLGTVLRGSDDQEPQNLGTLLTRLRCIIRVGIVATNITSQDNFSAHYHSKELRDLQLN
jgi:hypothetical protein